VAVHHVVRGGWRRAKVKGTAVLNQKLIKMLQLKYE